MSGGRGSGGAAAASCRGALHTASVNPGIVDVRRFHACKTGLKPALILLERIAHDQTGSRDPIYADPERDAVRLDAE